ncbi:PadR family transcriptional regulator [Rossellomorea marisflavi]|uniref:PadR family transcriptional regulator n=1 Tax=Rossellomorea marisflavi TaxID=189381 RepID=UPI00285354F4|nr:PadR family transcriptional regulator [Rossellomorea marisflavi]MDR4934967.1 PadR family transcriptional regulator [Rossellomorea marisflavi]
MRPKRGFVQAAILHLLHEEPMHGYQMMKKLEERSEGAYSASAGTIYPALQELVERQFILLDETEDKKVYRLSEAGALKIEEFEKDGHGDFWMEWKERMIWRSSPESVRLQEAMGQWKKEIHHAIKESRGRPEKALELSRFLEDMTKKLQDNNEKR